MSESELLTNINNKLQTIIRCLYLIIGLIISSIIFG